MSYCSAPTLDALLADPLVQAVMSADRVDAGELRRQMTRAATQLAQPARLDLDGATVRIAAWARTADVGGPPVAKTAWPARGRRDAK